MNCFKSSPSILLSLALVVSPRPCSTQIVAAEFAAPMFNLERSNSILSYYFYCRLHIYHFAKTIRSFNNFSNRTDTMATVATERSSTQTEARQSAQAYLNSRLTNGSSTSTATTTRDRPFTIPEIDISASFSVNIEDRRAVARQIHNACTCSGFFHITGHGIDESSRQAILDLAKRFFHTLPREKKVR